MPDAGNAKWKSLSMREPKLPLMPDYERRIAKLEATIRAKDAEIAEVDRNLQSERVASNGLRCQINAMEASRNRVAARNRQLIEALRVARVPLPRPTAWTPAEQRVM